MARVQGLADAADEKQQLLRTTSSQSAVAAFHHEAKGQPTQPQPQLQAEVARPAPGPQSPQMPASLSPRRERALAAASERGLRAALARFAETAPAGKLAALMRHLLAADPAAVELLGAAPATTAAASPTQDAKQVAASSDAEHRIPLKPAALAKRQAAAAASASASASDLKLSGGSAGTTQRGPFDGRAGENTQPVTRRG